MIAALLILLATLGVGLQMLALMDEAKRVGSGCTCRKGAVDWRCPIHGSGSS